MGLKADHCVRLAGWRRSLLHGTTHTAPSFPAFSSFCTLACPPSSCCRRPAVLAPLPSSVYIHHQLPNLAPVLPIVTVPDFLCSPELPHSTFYASCSSSIYHPLFLFLVFLLFVNVAVVMPTFVQSELSVCTLSANGLMSPVKLVFVGSLLVKLAPHFFALSKTKT
ncbi:hypothetical protein L208DRAFT_1269432 [Tricholoma matsutake]|nr:hypothetical protein L208DRAFT_1269432 [Tricholoma matsutake 945]